MQKLWVFISAPNTKTENKQWNELSNAIQLTYIDQTDPQIDYTCLLFSKAQIYFRTFFFVASGYYPLKKSQLNPNKIHCYIKKKHLSCNLTYKSKRSALESSQVFLHINCKKLTEHIKTLNTEEENKTMLNSSVMAVTSVREDDS